jgi:Activator of Hsp90 ATPase homolog 1-like protein
MTTIAGDAVRAMVFVALPPDAAFDVFTGEIDRWWRRGVRFRQAPGDAGIVLIEPRLGGRLFESYGSGADERVVEIGHVTAWEPPHRFVLDWRNVNFAPDERTEVEVTFTAMRAGTNVALTHRGWNAIRADHPARHGLAVPVFQRMMGSWWGDQLTSLRLRVDALKT